LLLGGATFLLFIAAAVDLSSINTRSKGVKALTLVLQAIALGLISSSAVVVMFGISTNCLEEHKIRMR